MALARSVVSARKTKEEVIIEFRRSSILDAAYRLFIAKGFESTTIDDIALGAGVAKGTVYLYYKSKTSVDTQNRPSIDT